MGSMNIYVLLLSFFCKFFTIIIHLWLSIVEFTELFIFNLIIPPYTKITLNGIPSFLYCICICNEGKNVVINALFYAFLMQKELFFLVTSKSLKEISNISCCRFGLLSLLPFPIVECWQNATQQTNRPADIVVTCNKKIFVVASLLPKFYK